MPRLKRSGKKLAWDYKRKQTIGRVKAFYGNFGVLVRAMAYILAHGGPGLRNATVDAVLNAVYIRKKLEALLRPALYPGQTCTKWSSATTARPRWAFAPAISPSASSTTVFHPYTVSFPLIVHGALMIEPTETEGKQEIDQFIEAMIAIAKEVETDPQLVKTAPHGTRTSRVDEVLAARKPILKWKPA